MQSGNNIIWTYGTSYLKNHPSFFRNVPDSKCVINDWCSILWICQALQIQHSQPSGRADTHTAIAVHAVYASVLQGTIDYGTEVI